MTKWKGQAASYAPNVAQLVSTAARHAVALALLASLAAGPASAADRYWDANRNDSGWGGTGTWDVSNFNWSPNSDGTSGPFNQAWNNNGIVAGTIDNAIFGGTAGTVTLGAPVTVRNITFQTNGYALSGGTLTLDGATPTITVTTGTSTISSVVAGSVGLTKAGAGALYLTGANTFSGGITLSGGTLQASSNAALGAASNTITTTAAATLNVESGSMEDRVVSIAGGTTLAVQGTGVGSAKFTGSGNLNAFGGVTLNNDENDFTGTMTLSGYFGSNASIYFTSVGDVGDASSLGAGGTITFTRGDLSLLRYIGGGDSSNRDWVMSGDGARRFLNEGAGTLTLSGDISLLQRTHFEAVSAGFDLQGEISGAGSAVFTAATGRTITLGNANSFTGTATITGAGVVTVGKLSNAGVNSSLGAGTGDITIDNGTLQYEGSGDSSNRAWYFSTAATLRNDGDGALNLSGAMVFNPGPTTEVLTLSGTSDDENTISGDVSGSGRVVTDGGIWVLSGTNTYTGTTTVKSGTLRAGSASALGASGTVVVDGGILDLNNYNYTFNRLDGSGGEVKLGTGDITLNIANNVTATYAGRITGDGDLYKTGAGKQILTGQSTYTGSTNISGGTLELSFAGAGSPTANIISASSALNMSGGTLTVTGVANDSQTFNGLYITGGGNTISATNATINFGAVSRSTGIVDFSIGTGAKMTVAEGTTLGGWATVNGRDYATVNDQNEIVAFTNYALGDDAATWSDGEIVADTEGAANTQFYGIVRDAAGGDDIVQLGGLRYAAAADSTVTVDVGQTLGVDGAIIVGDQVGSNSLAIQGGSMRGAAGGVLGIQQNSTGTFTINSTIVNNGGATGLTVMGTGTAAGKVVLGNDDNSYTGVTRVTRGTLEVGTLADGGVVSSIGMSSADSKNLVLEASRFSYTGGTDETDRGITLMRSGAVAENLIRVTQAGTNLTIGGAIVSDDGAGLTKEGAGTLTLTSTSSNYTGVTTVSGGTLAVTSLGNGGENSTIGASSSDSSNLVIGNGATFRYDGATDTSDRGFTLGTGTGSAIFNVSSSGTTLTMSGNAVGSNNLIKDGAGVLVLAGNNTYNSNTVRAGTLRAGSTTAFGRDIGLMNVESGARLELDTFSNVIGGLNGAGTVDLGTAGTRLTLYTRTAAFTGTITGAGELAVTGGAVQTLNGCNHTYTGATVISNGTLITDCIRDGNEASGIGASPAGVGNLVFANGGVLRYTGVDVETDRGFTLQGGWGFIDVVQAAAELEFEGSVVGAGSLAKRAAGTLILSGTNTSTGHTSVEGGTLVAGSAQAFGSGLMYIQPGALVDTTGFNNTVQALSDNNTAGGVIDIGTRTLTLSAGGASFAGKITGTTGNLVKIGGGTQVLSGCENDYEGSTTIGGGWLRVTCIADGGQASSIGASSNAATNLVIGGPANAGLEYVGDGDTTDRRFTLGAGAGYIYNNGTGALEFTNTAAVSFAGTGTRQFRLGGSNTATNIMAAQIVNNGASETSLVKEDAGIWRLTNTTSTYTGITTIQNGGVLEVVKLADGGQASSIGAATADNTRLVINTGSHLRYVGAGDSTNRLFRLGTGATYIESSGTGAIDFTGTGGGTMGFAGAGARTLALGGTYTGDNIMGVVIQDQDSATAKTTLAKNDAGTWILTGNNTYTGNTVINDGKLIIGNGGTTGNVGTGPVILAFETGVLGFNRSDTVNFAGQISGPGVIEQMGEGTTVLTADNTAGTVRISEGTLQVDGDLTLGDGGVPPTITFDDDEATALIVNAAMQGPAGNPAVITGDGQANTIDINAGGMLVANGDLGGGSDIVTLAGTLDTGVGVLNLGLGDDTLTLDDSGAVVGQVAGGSGTDTLQVNNAAAMTLAGDSFTGFESLEKTLGGTLTLTGDHAYSGGTTIADGTLQIGNGATAGSLTTPTVANEGTLAFNLDSDYTFDGAISGSGLVEKLGTGVTTLTGANSYKGATNVDAGTLLINGDQTGATGLTSVASGATLGGTGIIGGSVTVAAGGTLGPGGAGNAPGELTINGGLTLNDNSILAINFGQAGVVGGAFNDLIEVGGNLTLDGTLNITETPGGDFGPGVYRIFSYAGDLTNNTLDVTDPDYFVQTAVDNQVNLVNSQGLALSFWDGDAGPHLNEVVNGGDGTWRAAGDQNWTDSTGLFAAPFDNARFAVFQGTAGTVSVDGDGEVQALGMQFATDGYAIEDGGVELVDDATQPGQSIIRVGDGTADGAGYVATIASVLSGATQLVKTDLGTLVLSGTNTYTGGTAINAGTVQISSDANLGAAGGALSLDGGTLRNTAVVTSGRVVTLGAAGGTFDTLDTLALSGTVGGTGALTKEDGGTLILAGNNSYQGGTFINGGTVQITADANLGNATGKVTFDGGTLHQQGAASIVTGRDATFQAGGGTFQVDSAVQWDGAIEGAGALTKTGTGALFLGNDNSYAGGTTIASGILLLGTGGTTGSILGDVVNNGTLSFNRSNLYTFDGRISGSGGVSQDGTGNTVLTADNSYAGTTLIAGGGGLYINGDQSAATGLTNVNFGTLGGNGTIGGDVFVDGAGRLAPGGLSATPGTLTINGNLELADGSNLDYSFGQAGVVGGAYNDLTVVHGNLSLDGTINVSETPGGSFGPGIYRIITYDGSLTNLGLSESSPNHVVQTSIDGQVNLVEISAMTLNFWDGDTGPKGEFVNGGNGHWRAAGDDNWTEEVGDINAAFSNGSFAIFAGVAGTVDVDNTNGQVRAAGMQFATDGYLVQGGNIELVGPQAAMRVGDGTAPGAAYVATIASVLEGDAQLVKRDLGTLVLSGNNAYTGGTFIDEGTVQISSDANLGDAAGGLAFDGGTLRNMAALASSRAVTLEAAGGTFLTEGDLTLSGVIGGAGGLVKSGTAALTLTGDNIYGGSTTVTAGSLFVEGNQDGADGALTVQSGAFLGGGGRIGGDVTIADGATLSPGAADGTPGTLAVAGNLTLSAGSTLNYSFGEANVAGGALNDLTTVGGDLVLDGTLNVSVSPGGTFGPGIYRVFTYNGTLTDNGLSVATIPSTDYFVQTAIAKQVNLVNTAGLTMNYWDGGAGPKFNGVIDGGDGIWQSSVGNDNWADATGIVNAAFSDDAFAIFSGTSGTVMVDNSLGQVSVAGMQFATDGYVIQGDRIGLDAPASTIRVGDGTNAGGSMTATIAAELAGTTQLVKTDAGTLVLTGSNSYAGGTAINGGTLQVSTDANLGAAHGVLSFNGGTLHTTGSFESGRALNFAGAGTLLVDAETTLTSTGALSGGGSFIKDGEGTLSLGADGSGFTGTTSIEAGTLAVNGSLCGDVNVRDGGRLQGTGTVCDTNNFAGGTVAPGNSIGTLTVDGNYAGDGGSLEIEAELGGDASPADKLVVTGDTSGTTSVKVINVGGGGAQTSNGIKIVDVGGTSAGTFSLAGDYLFQGEQAVVGGAYAYRLYKGGTSTPADGDWYLRSSLINPDDPDPQPLYAPGVPLYEAYASVLQDLNELGTLQQRVGNRAWGQGAAPRGTGASGQQPVDSNAIWARIEAAHAQLEPAASTTVSDYETTVWKLQAGIDGLLHESEAGVLIGGLTAHLGTVSADILSVYGTGSISSTGYGIGGTLTWYGESGFYADAQAQLTWYDSDLRSATLATRLADGHGGFGYALGIEAGQKIAVGGNWSLTPQAQLAYSSVSFDEFTDRYDAAVSLRDSDRLTGRLGLSADYEEHWMDAAGMASRAHVYGIGNLYYDFLGRSDVDVSGVALTSRNQALWGGLGLGGSLSWADGYYTVYGEAFARTSLEDFGDSNAVGAKLGFSVKW